MVVLPAPLGPRRAKTVPSATSRSMPSRTTCLPYDLRSPVARIATPDSMVVMPRLPAGERGDDPDQMSRSSTAGCLAEEATLS